MDGDKISFNIIASKLYCLGHSFHSPMNRRGDKYNITFNDQKKEIIDNGSTASAVPYLIGSDGGGVTKNDDGGSLTLTDYTVITR